MPVTIKKIAEYAGLSVGTVSRALNNDPLIAEKTRAKIQNLATELDYVPNNIGRALQSQKSFIIGFLLDNIKSSFYDDILQGVGNVLCQHQYGLMTAITNGNPKSEQEQLQIFREKNVDGIIISNYHPDTIKLLRKITNSGTPVVCCDIEPFDHDIPFVMLDDKKAMHEIMSHLKKLGHKNIAFGFIKNQNSHIRYNACVEFAIKNKLPEPVSFKNNDELDALLNKNNPPTAIACYSDMDAINIIHHLKEKGLKVPNDISVVGFDDVEYASWPEFNLTSIFQPKKELGSISADVLLNAIKNKNEAESRLIEPVLMERQSTKKIN